MIFSVFEKHSNVIVTRFTPKELQEALIKNEDILSFIGIIGSDTALKLASDHKISPNFMMGSKIPKKYYAHTRGGCMALPAESFIVAIRGGDSLSPLSGKLRGRKILATIESKNEQAFSSTMVKKSMQNGESINSMVSGPVRSFIEKHDLYQ
jgi:hypothetical protein